MTTSPLEAYFSKTHEITEEKIPEEVLDYFRARLKDQFHDVVIEEFIKRKEEDPNFSKAVLARRLGKRPEQISRWLGSPGNWTSDTFSDLLIAISGAIPNLVIKYIEDMPKHNYSGPSWCENIEAMGAAVSGHFEPDLGPSIPTIEVSAGRPVSLVLEDGRGTSSSINLMSEMERVTP